ncbi:hypothetical protein Pmani_032046 [Petrolisthes manimaculis]|uniref:Uncharacterized protein n=1 Tax=Petrolisthes manimaculis TaxID=1843537 RepID=A0AAE1NUG7_9EUCA|nr:hypothetical protein Pmani_032046 [Petrolisthes manimaculis]
MKRGGSGKRWKGEKVKRRIGGRGKGRGGKMEEESRREGEERTRRNWVVENVSNRRKKREEEARRKARAKPGHQEERGWSKKK